MINCSTEVSFLIYMKNMLQVLILQDIIQKVHSKLRRAIETAQRHLFTYIFDQLSGRQTVKDGNLFIPALLLYLGLF